MVDNSSIQVLVTGGSGFLGSHCILQLLNQGYIVKTTIRNLNKKEQVINALKAANTEAIENLSFVEADLLADSNWSNAIQGCDFVLHTASPFPYKQPKNENDLIKPAVDGTLRILKAANQGRVKRVVITSSFAAVGYTHKDEATLITESNWTDLSAKQLSPYIKSKTIAEKAAWEFVNNQDPGFELAIICPRLIIGPSLSNTLSTSLLALQQLFDGSMKASPNISYGIVDVRDVADLHIRTMTHPKAAGERFLAASGDPMAFQEMATIVKKKFGEHAKQVSVRVYPDWLVRIVALFNPTAKNILHQLGKTFKTDNSKPMKLLGWAPRSNQEAILDTFESMIISNATK